MSAEAWIDNLVSIVLLVGVWCCVFGRRSLARPENLLLFAALCLPFAEVLTVSAGMRLIPTDWLALALLAVVIARPSGRQRMSPVQRAGIGLAALLAVLPLLALPFFESSDVSAAALELGPIRGGQLPDAPMDLYLSYGVQALRWIQQCALLIVIVVLAGTERRWQALIDWTIVGSTMNCLYGLYQASRFWLGWVDLPLLPFTYGRHVERASGYFRATGFMWEPTLFGSFTALALLLVLFRLTSAPSRRLWAVLVLHMGALVLSFSAAGIVAASAGWLVFFLASPDRGGHHTRRALLMTTAACVVVGALAMSPEIRDRLTITIRKVVAAGAEVPSSRQEREAAIALYFAELLPEIDSSGIGIGQLAHVADMQVPLPLKVWAEQGFAGLLLLAGLCLAVAGHVWRRRRARADGTAAVSAALLVALGVVVLVQGGAKINFVFFFSGLLLALPGPDARPHDAAAGAADDRPLEHRQAAGLECGS